MPKMIPAPDLRAMNPNRDGAHSTTCVIRPSTTVGTKWLEDNVESEVWQEVKGGLVMEARAAAKVLAQARAEGLVIAFGWRETDVEEFHPTRKGRKKALVIYQGGKR